MNKIDQILLVGLTFTWGEIVSEHTNKTQYSEWTIRETEAGKEGKGWLEEGLPCRKGNLPRESGHLRTRI